MCSGFTPVPVSPSPKSHAYDSIEPSGSSEADASNAHSRASQLLVKDAFGFWFGVPANRNTARPRQSSELTSVEGPEGTPASENATR